MDAVVNRVIESPLNNSVKTVLNMLDDAIEEYEKGEFITEEDLLKELENI